MRLTQAVWKYIIPDTTTFTLDLPGGGEVLEVASLGNIPYLWALVTPGQPVKQQKFLNLTTGAGIREPEERLTYLGTYRVLGDSYVGHIFEVSE